jgi:hypothetical protein
MTVCGAVPGNCHDAIHARHVIILPLVEGQRIDADKGFKLMFVNGWKPEGWKK